MPLLRSLASSLAPGAGHVTVADEWMLLGDFAGLKPCYRFSPRSPQSLIAALRTIGLMSLLDKTALIADETVSDKFRLGFTLEDRRSYASLTPEEKKSFNEELAVLARNNSLMRMSRRWESCKFESPALDINLGHQAFQKIRQAEATEPLASGTDATS